ncbi:MAG: hypothetical protein R3C05_07505 [Pirellulaceae bacterium]
MVALINRESGCCVSILLPTHQRSPDSNENAIRFKNAVRDAQEQVDDAESGLQQQLQAIAKLEHDFNFWQHQLTGLAIYVTSDAAWFYRTTSELAANVYVGPDFLIRPLAIRGDSDSTPLTLALSWEHARLFHSDGQTVSEIENDYFPVTMDQLVTERDPEQQLQFNTHSVGNADVAMYHGHGDGEDKIEADRDMYLSRVGERLVKMVYNTNRQILLMATEEVAGHFRSTTNVEIQSVVHMSPDGVQDDALNRRIMESSASMHEDTKSGITERLGTAIANQKGAKDISEIVPAASTGRIETLLIGSSDPIYGAYDGQNQKVRKGGDSRADLVNMAVRETLRTRGTVVHCGDSLDSPVAAIFRY